MFLINNFFLNCVKEIILCDISTDSSQQNIFSKQELTSTAAHLISEVKQFINKLKIYSIILFMYK